MVSAAKCPSCSSNQISSWTFRLRNAKLTWMHLPPSLHVPNHSCQPSHSQTIYDSLQKVPLSLACHQPVLAPLPLAQRQAAARFKASLKPLYAEWKNIQVLGWELVLPITPGRACLALESPFKVLCSSWGFSNNLHEQGYLNN